MPTFSDSEITAAVEDVSPQTSEFSRADGTANEDQELAKVQADISEGLISDPDSALYMVLQCRDQIVANAEKAITELAGITELLESIRGSARGAPVVNANSLSEAKANLEAVERDMGLSAMEWRLTVANKRVDEVLSDLNTSARGVVYRRKQDVSDKIFSHFSTVEENYAEILTMMVQIGQILTEYADVAIRAPAVAFQSKRGGEVIDDVTVKLGEDKEKHARDAVLKLSMLKFLSSRKMAVSDPLANKVSVVGVPAAPSTKAKLTGTATAPFRLTSGAQLTMTVDDVSKGVWELPTSTQAEIEGGEITQTNVETVAIKEDAAAELLSSDGTFNLTRVQVTHVITVPAGKPSIAYLSGATWGTDYSTVAIGDILWLTAPRRVVGLEGSVARLDADETPGAYSNKYVLKDNRFYVTVDGGAPQALVFPYTAAPPSSYAATSATMVAAAFTISGATDSVFGAKYKIESATSGEASMVAVGTTAFSQALGLAGSSGFGTAPNNVLNIEVDGTSISHTITPSTTYTVTTLAANLNGISGAACVTHTSGTGLTLKTDAYGPPGTLKILGTGSANDVLGFVELDILKRGEDVTIDQLKESLKADAQYGEVFEITSEQVDRDDPGLATANGTTLLTFDSADLISGVEANDTLVIEEGGAAGTYKVVSKSSNTLTLESAVIAGSYSVNISKEPLEFVSKVTTTSSSLQVSAGAGQAALGLPTTASRGTVTDITLTGVDFSTLVSPPVRKGDKVSFAGQDLSIIGITEPNTLALSSPITNNSSGTAVVKPLGSSLYSTIIDGVVTWNSTLTQATYSPFSSGLTSYFRLITDTVNGPSGIGAAVASTAAFGDLLTLLKDQILGSYQANIVDGVDDGFEALRAQGLDRAVDILKGGNLKEFFALTSLGASYKAMTLASLSSVYGEFELPEGMDEDDLDFGATTSGVTDAGSDFSDTTESENPTTLGDSLGEEPPETESPLELY